ncbi:hypothetical protein BKH13_00825 [Actinomyces naeslundii]|uniref:DUF3618 domain-containing protein n=1 Tax=Actinomyces naeslundii TaxID=1655 RepID=A0ABX3F4M6_ACTNA|nr:DUF3618 domain-containing protein [Actinomyces naeslundii]OLO83351.1 hypothetical protein BKH12_08025 [Actinomyces naeslundii]OLO86233.1 hypothetical protein BKH13_00825 [Actinomyces naeslundii]OLO92859.1 hypothetical protein BKH09_03985 [Actinomyces naeslundii]
MTSGQQAGASGADGAGAAGSGSLSPEQIEERLRAQRVALAASVDEFASRVDPRTQAREAGEHLREQASARADHLREQAAAGAGQLREEVRRWAEQAEETWERAKQGDSEATSTLAKAAAVAGGVVTAGIVLSHLARR